MTDQYEIIEQDYLDISILANHEHALSGRDLLTAEQRGEEVKDNG